MKRRRGRTFPILVAAAAGFALSACQTDNLNAYRAPINAQNSAVSTSPASTRGAATASADTSPFPYRLADLKPDYRPNIKSEEAGLWLQMDEVEKAIKSSGNRVRNPKVTRYVQSVVCRVAGKYCKDIRVYVMRVPYFNANMAPNGMMQVYTGLLLRVHNEAQLAAVVGHEIGHYLRRHTIQHMREVIDATNSMFFLQVGLAVAGAPVGSGDIANLMMLGSIRAFSRNQEREADGYSLLLMARAGYDPNEAWKIWQQQEQEQKANKDHPHPDPFLADHPATQERLETLRKLAKEVRTPQSTFKGRQRLLDVILPIRAGLLRDELNLRRYDSFDVLLDRLLKDGANKAQLYYFKGELRRLRGKKGDYKTALKNYQLAKTAAGKAPADIDRSIALVYDKMGKTKEANAAFQHYLQANPHADDAAMIRSMIQESAK